jgi:outer membrane protein assembly factor BamD
MLIRLRNIFYLSLSVLIFSACNGYQRTLKSKDVNYKLTKANEYYDKKKYEQANAIYESLIPVMTHTRNAEPLYLRYAWSFYYMKDYLSASYHFKNFVDMYSSSEDADECEYMYGVSLYKMSPKSSLDQANTAKSLEALQSYINTHPDSKHTDEASKYITDCLRKLEGKEASAADLYYKIGRYKAAGMAFKNVLRNYPESVSGDYYHYMIIKSFYSYAKESVKDKQEERYASAENAFQELKENYPQSKYLQEAGKYHTLADNNIKRLRNEHK